MNDNYEVTNAEIVEYLDIAYNVLKYTKSSLDLNRLKVIMDVLKKEEKRNHSAETKKVGVRNEIIIKILEKRKCNIELLPEEQKIYNEVIKDNSFFGFAQERNYEELYKLLKVKEKDVTAGELSALYFELYEERTKQKKKTDLLRGIYAYIEQNMYFDNMDLKYKKTIKEKKI